MRSHLVISVLGFMIVASPARSGVVNPDISVIGQPVVTMTDDPADPDRERLKLDAGETEFVFDAYLNPYAKGYFTLALGEEGMDLEEGYFIVLRGIPLGLDVKAGKYRVGFGKLNPAHPHTYPFGERFNVLGAYLPGEEAMNDTGISVSKQFALVGETSITATVDYLQGGSFRIEREPGDNENDPLLSSAGDGQDLSRPAAVARLSGFAMLGELSGLEAGVSATRGINNVAAGAQTTVIGADLKAKLWRNSRAYLLLQGEVLRLDREDAAWTPDDGYMTTNVKPLGGYLFADYNFGGRYNTGVSYEQYQEPTREKAWDKALGAFAGYALMEETLVFRLVYSRSQPEVGDGANTVRLHVVYSMGPHKAHQF